MLDKANMLFESIKLGVLKYKTRTVFSFDHKGENNGTIKMK